MSGQGRSAGAGAGVGAGAGASAKSSPASSVPSNVCKFYAKGICQYGNKCFYIHVKPKQEQQQQQPKQQQQQQQQQTKKQQQQQQQQQQQRAPVSLPNPNSKYDPEIASKLTVLQKHSSPYALAASTGLPPQQPPQQQQQQQQQPQPSSVPSWWSNSFEPTTTTTTTTATSTFQPPAPKPTPKPAPWSKPASALFSTTTSTPPSTSTSSTLFKPSNSTTTTSSSTPTTAAPQSSLFTCTSTFHTLNVNAKEFIPGRFYIDENGEDVEREVDETNGLYRVEYYPGTNLRVLCPYAEATGTCQVENCTYLHGDICPCCMLACLHPDDPDMSSAHIDECVAHLEASLEQQEVASKSADVECSICMEKILEKANLSDRRFGIMQNCIHPFCLGCLRTWRAKHEEQGGSARTCPICRTVSYFVVPSSTWVTNIEEKKALIDEYKAGMSNIECKYYRKGEGECPFGTSCFYRHINRDGSVGTTRFQPVLLWDYLAARSDGTI